MAGRAADRRRVGPAAVHPLDLSAVRIGSVPPDTDADDGYGLTTLLRDHVRLGRGDRVALRFSGKGGVRRDVAVHSPALTAVIRAMRRIGTDDRLWHYRDGSGLHRLTAAEVNEDVGDLIGPQFSAKDLRTWHATVAAAWILAHRERSEEPEGEIRAAIGAVAGVLGDTIRPFGDRWHLVCADDDLRERADRAVGRLLRR